MATFKEFDTGSDEITQLCYFCDSNVSDGFCGVCEDYMCQSCFDIHTKAISRRHHVLVDGACKNSNKKTHTETCKRHPNQIIKFYCVAHKIVGCVECFFPEHRNCNYQNIETAAKIFRDSGEDTRLKREIQRLENTHSEYTKQYEDDKETVVVINNTVVKDVKSFTDSVTSYVAQVEKRMLEQSERLRIENENWLERRSDDLDCVGNEIEKCKMKLENEDRVDTLFISAMELGPAIEKLRKNIASIGRQHAVTKYEFQPNKLIMEMTNGSGSFGDICILPDNNGEGGSPYPDEEFEPEQSFAKLLVTNLPTYADEEYIEWFFSKKTFGRLEVQDVVYNDEDACAIVEFGSPEDVDAVLQKVPIKFNGQEVDVERYKPEPEEPIDPCMVRVSGPEAVLSDLETLEFFFEHTKRSGGGEIALIKYDEDLNVVVIQFAEEEAAQRVIEKKDHKVKKQTVTVEQFTPVRKQTFRREENVLDEDFEDAKEGRNGKLPSQNLPSDWPWLRSDLENQNSRECTLHPRLCSDKKMAKT